MAKWLDDSTLGQMVVGFEMTFRPVTKCEEIVSLISVTLGKRAKRVRRYGHINRKDQGGTF